MINFRDELNDEQFQVVTHGDGPVLVLAGAGSGKTRTITYRVAYLLEQGVPEDRILLVTFTNKAAQEMIERVTQLIGHKPEKLWAGTFHSVAVRMLKQHAVLLGYKNNFTILDADDAVNLVKRSINDEGAGASASAKKKFPSPNVVQGIISYSRNAQTTIEDVLDARYESYAIFADEITAVAKRYETKKKEANAMDFDDLLTNLLLLLQTQADVREKLSWQFQYILVDEYQDTNTIQAAIVKILSNTHHNVLVVGDDAQSIYSFRAANIEHILGFEKDFPGAAIYRLETNYRSSPDIVSVANSVIAHNKKQFKKNLKSTLQPGVKPKIVPSENPLDEAEFIARRVEQLRDAGNELQKICVLFRAVHHVQALEFELARRNIPYELRGGMRFFERSHIKDVLAFLRIVNNLDDHLAWLRVLGMAEGVGPATAQKILEVIRSVKTFDELEAITAVPLSGRAKEGWWQCMQTIKHMFGAPERTPSSLIKAVLDAPQYREYLQSEYTSWQERYEDLQQLAVLAMRTPDLDAFLAEASLQEQFSNNKNNRFTKPKAGTSLILSTIHQAKGLEWDTVFVIHLLTPGFPNERALKEPGGIEEERRLFYVAVTRARHNLYFTYPASTGKELSVYEEPSMFLNEIEPHLLEGSSTTTKRLDIFKTTKEDDPFYEEDENSQTPAWRSKSFLKNLGDL